jgi:hypothetical protein
MDRRIALAATLLLAAAGPVAAQVVDLAGAKFAPTQTVAGSPLALNGAGIRYKFVIKVYAAGLYLGTKAATPEAVLAAPGAKRLQVQMLRDIDANELGRLFTRGMQDNAPKDEWSRLIPGTIRMSDIFSSRRKLNAGDGFTIDWVPGQGTVIGVNGQPQGEPIKEPEFYNALLRIWLGPSPADANLKLALLGQAPRHVASPGQQ